MSARWLGKEAAPNQAGGAKLIYHDTPAAAPGCERWCWEEAIKPEDRLIVTKSDGREIIATTFWRTEAAQGGYFYASFNAGALRLLVPPARENDLAEMRTGKYAVISQGPQSAKYTLEVLFEGGSDSPYALQVCEGQTDRRLPAKESGRTDLELLVYTQTGLQFRMPARFRCVSRIPWLKPWGETYG